MGYTIIILLGLGIVGVIFLWPHRAVNALQWMTRRVVWKVVTQRPVVALTFDDGPDPVYTPQVLDLLKHAHVRATFFLVGERAEQYPTLVARICAEGHEIGNHSHTWRRTISLSSGEFVHDLERAQESLDTSGCTKKIFRPAGIWIRPSQVEQLADRGYACVLGSAYGHDPMRPPASYIAWVIRRALAPGAIIVMHDAGGDRTATVAALHRVLEAVRQRRMEFVLLSSLLAEQHK